MGVWPDIFVYQVSRPLRFPILPVSKLKTFLNYFYYNEHPSFTNFHYFSYIEGLNFLRFSLFKKERLGLHGLSQHYFS